MTVQHVLFKLQLAQAMLAHPEHQSSAQLTAARKLKRKMQTKLDKLRSVSEAGNVLGLKCRAK